jgi:hypothetical protein
MEYKACIAAADPIDWTERYDNLPAPSHAVVSTPSWLTLTSCEDLAEAGRGLESLKKAVAEEG